MNHPIPDAVLDFIDVGEGPSARRIAVRRRAAQKSGQESDQESGPEPGQGPGLVWLGGVKTDMRGSKAVGLGEWGPGHRRAGGRFGYFGPGATGGDFAAGTIARRLRGNGRGFEAFFGGP